MRILGIDPGTKITGFGIIEKANNANEITYVSSGCIRTKSNSMAEKLNTIFQGIQQLTQDYAPTYISIEQAFAHKNFATTIKLGQARGVAIVAACQNNLPLSEYTPRQIKKAVVGYGNADKQQVQHMVKLLLKLEALPQSDAADALAVAICHYNVHNFSSCIA